MRPHSNATAVHVAAPAAKTTLGPARPATATTWALPPYNASTWTAMVSLLNGRPGAEDLQLVASSLRIKWRISIPPEEKRQIVHVAVLAGFQTAGLSERTISTAAEKAFAEAKRLVNREERVWARARRGSTISDEQVMETVDALCAELAVAELAAGARREELVGAMGTLSATDRRLVEVALEPGLAGEERAQKLGVSHAYFRKRWCLVKKRLGLQLAG